MPHGPSRRFLAPRTYSGPIALTAAEIRRLFHGLDIAPLTAPMRAISDIQYWSTWRLLYQAHVRRSHYQRRFAAELDP